MKRVLLGTVSLLVLAGAAAAADMPLKAPRMVQPAWSWAGCYLGGHGAVVSYRSGLSGIDTDFGDGVGGSQSQTTGGGGGQIGCNWQDQNLVYGIEGDATFFRSRTDIVGFEDDDYNYHTQVDWIATVRGRVGITAGTNGATLLYATGGLAFGGVKSGISFDGSSPNQNSHTQVGWTGGVGVERMILPHWTVKAEVLYVDLGSTNYNDNSTYNLRFSHEFVMGKVGLNYKF
jgi:outer membrane immunogenic protein